MAARPAPLPVDWCNVLAFQGEHLADQDGAEDQHESHDQLEPHLLTVQKHAEQHAEHRFQTEEQRRLRGRHMRQRHVLDDQRHARREDDQVGHVPEELGREGPRGRERLEAGAARHAARAADEELHHREHQHVVRPRELRHVHDVHREQQRRHQRLGVSSIGEYSGRKKLESRDVSQERRGEGRSKADASCVRKAGRVSLPYALVSCASIYYLKSHGQKQALFRSFALARQEAFRLPGVSSRLLFHSAGFPLENYRKVMLFVHDVLSHVHTD